MQNRFIGCLLGLAIGDALGAPVEFLNAEEIKQRHGRVTDYLGGGWLNLKPGECSDDTALMLCIARSIVDRKGFDPGDIAQRFLKWLAGESQRYREHHSYSIAGAKEGRALAGGWQAGPRKAGRHVSGQRQHHALRAYRPAPFP